MTKKRFIAENSSLVDAFLEGWKAIERIAEIREQLDKNEPEEGVERYEEGE